MMAINNVASIITFVFLSTTTTCLTDRWTDIYSQSCLYFENKFGKSKKKMMVEN